MSRWLVSSIPAWLLLIGLIVVVAGGAMLIQRYVRCRYPVLNGDEHNDVTKFTYGFIGFVYAFFIGFVVSAMWGQINTADGNARAEGAVAVQMARDLSGFEKADGDRIRQGLLAYEQAAIAEWPRAGAARTPEAESALAQLSTAYRQVQAPNDPQKTVLATSLSNLDDISQARTVRLPRLATTPDPMADMGRHLPDERDGPRDGDRLRRQRADLHYPMVAIVGVIVAANVFLILELSHPYVGAVSTESDPLQEVVWVLSQRLPTG
jgi:hypothetical protein